MVAAGVVAAGVVAAGACSGAASTALRGAADGAAAGAAGAGGAVTAGIDALATGVPGEPDPVVGEATEGGGGGAEPTPNRDGEAVGEEGSANGADCAACCALARSATSDAVSFFNASASGVSGLPGTVAMFGKG